MRRRTIVSLIAIGSVVAVAVDGDSADCVNPGEALAQEILANPSEFYVNVHNADYPGGAIRGQLRGV
ncbi:MAG TPA: CHRD domain-containing protein [Gaiellaceae bacterium]|nr:CHRD domain-containing protein [Gaiellaceae bacterium]